MSSTHQVLTTRLTINGTRWWWQRRFRRRAWRWWWRSRRWWWWRRSGRSRRWWRRWLRCGLHTVVDHILDQLDSPPCTRRACKRHRCPCVPRQIAKLPPHARYQSTSIVLSEWLFIFADSVNRIEVTKAGVTPNRSNNRNNWRCHYFACRIQRSQRAAANICKRIQSVVIWQTIPTHKPAQLCRVEAGPNLVPRAWQGANSVSYSVSRGLQAKLPVTTGPRAPAREGLV